MMSHMVFKLGSAHAPVTSFGFIIDFHTLVEHFHHAITGTDALKQLQTIYKLKVSTLSEALSPNSFEGPDPALEDML